MLSVLRMAVLLACLTLLGCGSDEDTPTAASPTRLTETIKYEAIGGDAFRDDEITVRTDGSATVQTRTGERAAKLTVAELSELARGIETAGLGTAASALTDPPVPDALSYRFTYRGRQVETDSAALPDRLGPLIGTFDALIDRYGV
jgi:hypothetical protein